jgi:hypothetical protein
MREAKSLAGLHLGVIKASHYFGILVNPQIEFQVKHTDKPLERD